MKHVVLRVGLAAVATPASCDSTTQPDCNHICTKLEDCGFLPSVLGVQSADPNSQSLNSNCESRCNLEPADDPAYAKIHDCYQSTRASSAQCANLAACLHGAFPDTPITGLSRIELHGYLGDVDASAPDAVCSPDSPPDMTGPVGADAGPLSGCTLDAGSQTAFARAFVDVWGARQYSPTTACELPLLVAFENVPADTEVPMGFQITQDGVCVEYTVVETVAAGCDALRVTLNLAGAAVPCRPDAPDGGWGPEASAGSDDAGSEGAP